MRRESINTASLSDFTVNERSINGFTSVYGAYD